MQLNADWIHYPSGEQSLPGYLARPARVVAPLPAIIVIQEIWGVDGHIRDLTERFATAGYVALAPDLYGRGGRRPETLTSARVEAVKVFLDTLPPSAWMNPQDRDRAIAALPEEEGAQIRETLRTLFAPDRNPEEHVTDLLAAAAFLRAQPECLGRRIGSTGYCMGGALSALLACADPALGAAVIYYGAAPPDERLEGIRCPVLGLYGGDDPRVTGGVPAFAGAMATAGKSFQHRIYPDTPHAFFNDTRNSYRVDAARDAWARTLTFFAEHLAPVP